MIVNSNNLLKNRDMKTIKLSSFAVETIEEACSDFKYKEDELINILHRCQHKLGYLPAEVQELIAQRLQISVAKVYGVVSFYSFFSMLPQGKNPISICMGTACYVRGAEKLVDEFKRQLRIDVGETTSDGNFSLSCLRCVGACGLAPIVMVGDKVYGRVSVKQVKDIISEYQKGMN